MYFRKTTITFHNYFIVLYDDGTCVYKNMHITMYKHGKQGFESRI